MARTYFQCKFRPSDNRAWLYHADDLDLAVGDVVKVPHKSGEGWQRVTVVEVLGEIAPPKFETKAIVGKVEPAANPQEALADHVEDKRAGLREPDTRDLFGGVA